MNVHFHSKEIFYGTNTVSNLKVLFSKRSLHSNLNTNWNTLMVKTSIFTSG